MNTHDELLDGENIDPRDEAALREALQVQFCMDAALTAHLGGQAADHRIRQSVMAAIQSSSEPKLQRQVMRDARLHSARQPRTTGLAWASAAAIVFMGIGWWLLRAPSHETPVAEQASPPELPEVVEKAAPEIKPIAQAQPTFVEPPKPTAPKMALPEPAVATPPPAVIASTPQVMRDSAIVIASAPPVLAANPGTEMTSSLGTPPPASVAPPMSKNSIQRDPALWPFSVNSPWNMPVGNEAKLEAIVPAEFATQPIGFQPRTIFIATPQHPIVRFKRSRGAAIKVPFVSEWANALSMRTAPVTIIEPNGQWAIEYHGLTRDDDDWTVADVARISLLEDGVGRDARGVGELGLPALAGVIRKGEWQSGIHHVIGIIVPAAWLNSKAGAGKAHVWPAQPEMAPDTSPFAKRGNLHLGSLLTLPDEAHPLKLGLTEGTPHYHLALALWSHGACVLGSSREGNGGISLLTETLAPGGMERDALPRVFAQLQVVSNRSSTRPGGGGNPRCGIAPAFSPAR